MEFKKWIGIAFFVFFMVYGLVLAVEVAMSAYFKDGGMRRHALKLAVYWAAFYVYMRTWEVWAA